MKLIYFFIHKKLKNYYSINNWKKIVADSLFGICLIAYAAGMATAYNFSLRSGKIFNLPSFKILEIIKFSLFFIPIFLKFYPSVKLKQFIIKPQFPVNRLKIAVIDLVAVGFYKTINITLFLTVLTFSLVARSDAHVAVILFLFLFAGILSSENIINAISWSKYAYLIIIVGALILISFSIRTNSDLESFKEYQLLFLLIMNIALLLFYFLFYDNKDEFRAMTKSLMFKGAISSKFSLPVKILLRTKNFRTIIFFGILLKFTFIALFFFGRHITLDFVLNNVFFAPVFLSPIILFTYVFNNTWGYFYSLELNHLIINSSFVKQLHTFFSLLVPVLIVDISLTFCFLYYFHILEWKLILVYLIFSFYCAPLSIISSFAKYFYIFHIFDFTKTGNTSPLFSVIMLLPAFICGLIYNNSLYFIIFVIVLTIIAIIFFIYLRRKQDQLLQKFKIRFTSS